MPRDGWRALGTQLARRVPALRGVADVAIADCVHYCGFRYGRGEYNPYETYLLELAAGADVGKARARLIEFLRYYRPRHFGEALGCALSREYPLWSHPWRRALPPPAWREQPDDCPDILTHFSARGIHSYRIDEEFVWLERAFARLERDGYRPESHGYVVGVELQVTHGSSAFLLIDGNHRVAALSALGQTRVRLRRSLRAAIVKESEVETWPQVRSRVYTTVDALTVFSAYRHGNRTPATTADAAPLLAPSGWESICV
jgi:hypothetical protein